ncbi:MAG: D-alanyl-D-alanine carboxypeptidase [Proteobacteria bacterium]|nr:D-alanyl-D-alanine carboxypeptidase [Pseudomonadota bacterium]
MRRVIAWVGLAFAAVTIATWSAPETAEARATRHTARSGHHRVHHRRHRHRHHLLPVSASAPTAEIVFDAESGRVLAITNADQRVYPASLTKMMTLYLTFRALQEGWLHLNDTMQVSDYASAASPTKLGLYPGQLVTVDDLIRGCVTESANDAARVLAENLDARFGRNLQQLLRADIAQQQAEDAADALSDPPSPQDAADRAGEINEMQAIAASVMADGSEYDFARLMTLQARVLGMQDTVYRNSSGLPDMEQVTTAPDYAMLAYALIHMPIQYYSYFSVQHFDFNGADHRNHNLNFLTSYDGADGIKTGYTQSGGFNVVDTARRGNRRLVAVVMGRQSRATREEDVRTLLDQGFAQTGTVTAVSSVLVDDESIHVGSTLDFPTLQTTGVRRVTPQLPDMTRPEAPAATPTSAQRPPQRGTAPINTLRR